MEGFFMSTEEHSKGTDPDFFPKNVELLTFIGGWDCYVGIDTVQTLFYLIRTKEKDWLEEVVKYSNKIMTRKCAMSIPRDGSKREAAAQLLHDHACSRVHHECPVPPYQAGLLTSSELQSIVKAIANELRRNSEAAEEEQCRHEAPIIKMAKELGLGPRPAGHNDSAWMANCPQSRNHWIMISPKCNEFGCGYCCRKGGLQELRAFYDVVRSRNVQS
jgi:hypothetical protein